MRSKYGNIKRVSCLAYDEHEESRCWEDWSPDSGSLCFKTGCSRVVKRTPETRKAWVQPSTQEKEAVSWAQSQEGLREEGALSPGVGVSPDNMVTPLLVTWHQTRISSFCFSTFPCNEVKQKWAGDVPAPLLAFCALSWLFLLLWFFNYATRVKMETVLIIFTGGEK